MKKSIGFASVVIVVAVVACLLLVFPVLRGIPAAADNPTVVSVSNQARVYMGSNFTIDIVLTPDPVSKVAGGQFNLSFDPAAVRVLSVVQGSFFGSQPVYFMAGTIDNAAGTLKNNSLVITVPGGYSSSPGVMATINAVGLKTGSTAFTLSNVIIGNIDAVALPITIGSGAIAMSKQYDVNLDGTVSVLDLISVTQHFGENY